MDNKPRNLKLLLQRQTTRSMMMVKKWKNKKMISDLKRKKSKREMKHSLSSLLRDK